ncbi:hypothetical protein B0H19DRAFT_1071232 [Mycena capillaripes]|nr:hypothetical protein B0H19DRAFT_1071232 [Mycena capillaripes]
MSSGRKDFNEVTVRFGNAIIQPSEEVKWAESAARALNAMIAVTHATWGVRPLLIRDLALATILPRADYGVACFLPLPSSAFKPLERLNRSVARGITGSFRKKALASLEKEAAILPAHLRIEL